MNPKMMAHPNKLSTRIKAHMPKITVAIIVIVAVLVSYLTPVASARVAPSDNTATVEVANNSVSAWTEVVHTASGDCTLRFQQYAPGTKSVEDLLGPSYATVWVNQGAIPANGPYQGIRGQNPSWGTAERKAFVNLREELHLFWAGGTFVSATPRTVYCRNLLLKRYNNDARTAISRFTVEQVGLGLYNTDLR